MLVPCGGGDRAVGWREGQRRGGGTGRARGGGQRLAPTATDYSLRPPLSLPLPLSGSRPALCFSGFVSVSSLCFSLSILLCLRLRSLGAGASPRLRRMRPGDLPPRPMEEPPASSSAPTETEEPGSSAGERGWETGELPRRTQLWGQVEQDHLRLGNPALDH